MGKSSDNEKIKYEATYFNNMAVGLNISGGFVLFYNFIQISYKAGYVAGYRSIVPSSNIDIEESAMIPTVVMSIICITSALAFAAHFKQKAQKILEKYLIKICYMIVVCLDIKNH